MFRKLEYICLVGSIGLIGADRIDLLNNRVPFVVKPFLVLPPLVLLLHLLRVAPSRIFQFTIPPPIRRTAPFVVAASLFLLLTFASIPIGLDPERGLVAFSDLLLMAIFAYYILFRIWDDPEREKLILRSVKFALGAYILFCVGECIAWSLGLRMYIARSGPWFESTFAPGSLGDWLPALSGTTYDQNRSGFILVMYLVLLDKFVAKSRQTLVLRCVIGLLVFCTFSRSGILCWLAYHLCLPSFWKRLASLRAVLALGAIMVAISVACVVYQREILDLMAAWEIADAVEYKVSMDPGSSGAGHVLLIQRGFDTWLKSPKTVFTGIGFAAAPKVLEDFFGNDRHGNFHSLYVNTLAEMGLPAFVVLMFLLLYPIFGRKGVLPGIAALMIFNVAYQVHMEPMFWFTLALSWSCERRTPLRFGAWVKDHPSRGFVSAKTSIRGVVSVTTQS
jgi:hypothetical protein